MQVFSRLSATFEYRRLLLTAMVVGALAFPGSEGWAGSLADGDRLASEHRLLSALLRYEDASRHSTGLRPAQIRMGRVHLRRGQWREAAEVFGQAEARGAASREVRLGLATAQHRLGDVHSSLATLGRELAIRPENGEAWVQLVERGARAGLRPGEIREMLAGVPAPVGETPVGQKAAYLLGSCVMDPASREGSAALYRAATGADPRVAEMARELLEAADAVQGREGRAVSLAGSLLAQGLVGPALATLDGVGGDGPRSAEVWALRGAALLRLGDADEAERAIRRSLELAPEEPLGEFLLGSVLRHRGESEEAARLLRKVVGRAQPNPAFYLELANALVESGDYGVAEQALRLAVQAAPDSAEVRLAVVGFHVDRQYRVDRVLDDARDAVRLSGGSAEALGALGWALHLTGSSEEAVDFLLKAVSKDPESPLLRYRLGSVYDGLGRKDLAREQYLMVGELDGSGMHWQRVREALAEP